MSRIFKIYDDRMERVWYESSNIVYSECDDIEDELKKLRIVFKDGRQYQYEDVKVNDYLLFRENLSQGKALNQFIKPSYLATRLDDVDVQLIKESMDVCQASTSEDKTEVFLDGNILTISKNNEVIKELVIEDNFEFVLTELLSTLGVQFKILNK